MYISSYVEFKFSIIDWLAAICFAANEFNIKLVVFIIQIVHLNSFYL